MLLVLRTIYLFYMLLVLRTIYVTRLANNLLILNDGSSAYARHSKFQDALTYLDTWSCFEEAKTAPWPSRGLHHSGKFLEPSDE